MSGRIENLRSWKPGQSGNPGGRPKRDIAAEIARAIFERDSETIEQVFAAALKKGDPKIFAALADRAYGKPRQPVEQASEGSGSLQNCITVRFVNPGEPGGEE